MILPEPCFSSGEVTFRFPLVVAPALHTRTAVVGRIVGDGTATDTDAVPDASRISPPVLLPGYPNPVHFSMNIEVHPDGLPLSNFRSSLHAVANELLPGGATKITVQPGERLNRDVILRYRIAENAIQSSLTLAPDAEGNEGTLANGSSPAGRYRNPQPIAGLVTLFSSSTAPAAWTAGKWSRPPALWPHD